MRRSNRINASSNQPHSPRGRAPLRYFSRVRMGGLKSRFGLPIVAVAAGLGYLAYKGYQGSEYYQQQQPINDELLSAKPKAAYRERLITGFEDRHEKHIERITYRSILEAIEANDVEQIEESFESLFQDRHIPLTSKMRDEMIVYASNHDKVSVLEYFSEVFGDDIVKRNLHAKRLLEMPALERDTFERMVEQFHQSPGKIKHDGMLLYVKIMQEDMLDAALTYQAYDPIFTMDVDSDIIEMQRMHASRREITAELNDKFKHTAIISQDDYPQDQELFTQFLVDLKNDAIESGRTKVGTFMFTGVHFTIGQVKVNVRVDVDNQCKTDATVLFVDPLSSVDFTIMGTYYGPYSGIPHSVFDNVHTHISSELLQTRKNGCSIFTGYLYPQFIMADYILAANTQYEFAGKKNAIFDYAESQQASRYRFGIDYIAETDKYKSVGTYSFFGLPAFMTTHKQTYGATGIIKDSRVFDYVETEDASFEEVITEVTDVDVPGRRGVQVDMDKATPQRKQEFEGPVEIGSNDTVKERVEGLTFFSEYKGKVKPQNRRNDLVPYDMGHRVGKYLAEDPDHILYATRDLTANKH